MKAELAALEAKYTPSHPDVVRLKNMIENLEKKEENVHPDSGRARRRSLHRRTRTLEQLRTIETEIRSLNRKQKEVNRRYRMYQKWVDETPKREQELLSIKRDYENLKETYNSLLKRKLEADIAVSMEKKQKGEQFRVIDPAKIPTIPLWNRI